MPWYLKLQNFAFCAVQGSIALIQLREADGEKAMVPVPVHWAWCVPTIPELILLTPSTTYEAFHRGGPSLWSGPSVCAVLYTYQTLGMHFLQFQAVTECTGVHFVRSLSKRIWLGTSHIKKEVGAINWQERRSWQDMIVFFKRLKCRHMEED